MAESEHLANIGLIRNHLLTYRFKQTMERDSGNTEMSYRSSRNSALKCCGGRGRCSIVGQVPNLQRKMKRTFLVLALVLTCLSPASLLGRVEHQPTRAVSLKVLQEQLRACTPGRSCSEQLLELGGLTRIQGYVLDETSNDLVLLGQADPLSPVLYTENLVVALRNAWLKYAELKGDTYYYSDPGCSIDPDPAVMRELQELVKRSFLSTAANEMDLIVEQWHRICEQPQTVRVLGIPFDTRFARTMVGADYYMKRLANGSESLGIDGFASLLDMSMAEAREDVLSDRNASHTLSSMNRFWFCPGENKYSYDDGIVFLQECPVALLTEEQYLTKANQIAGRGRPDPLAGRFAQGFSDKYSEIAGLRPIYLELEALFRFVALAKIMNHRRVEETVGLGYLLNDIPLERIRVTRSLPGISSVKEFQHRKNREDGYEILRLCFPSCGGVAISIDMGSQHFERETTGELAELGERILKSRPSGDPLCWDLTE